jgi:hypothetical protein
MVMPMMGMPIFSGSAVMAMGSLLGHLVYGAVLGLVYGPVPEAERRLAHQPAPLRRPGGRRLPHLRRGWPAGGGGLVGRSRVLQQSIYRW